MSNNIFANIGADTAVSLQLHTNMRDLANFFDQDGKLKPEHLPESGKNGAVEAQPLPSDVVRTADILGADGKVKADLLPDSCKNEHC
ncbi:MAG: hypothetical protein HXK17_03505, partial [Alloprevotella sp.]|nr:hypothetical protein [Alloprevotella sp.]